MPECPRHTNPSTLAPPGFSNTNVSIKRQNLVELLQQIIDKCQQEPTFLDQQPKQIDLLVSIAQLTLLSTPMTVENRRDFLNNILTVGQDLLSDEDSLEIESTDQNPVTTTPVTTIPIEIKKQTTDDDFSLDDLANEYLQNEPTPPSSTEKSSTPTEPITILPTATVASIRTDADGDFSLDDLANEYLQNEPTPSSLTDKPAALNESEEPALAFETHSQTVLSTSAPVTNILSSLIFPPPASEPIEIKAPLESILFSNRLSSSDAADDADCIWKDHSSAFGQMFCTKTEEIPIVANKRISSCLLDRSLYERLARLVSRLPKQYVRNNVQQQTIRPNEQNNRRGNHDTRRPPPANRLSFQQNSAQIHNRQQAPPNSRQYSNYGNPQSNSNGHYIDRRQQQQQQNRYPIPNFAPYPMDQQYQPKGPPKNNAYNHNQQQQQQQQHPQQQKKKPQNNNQSGSNQYPPQQRGPKKGGGGGNGNQPNHDKSGASGTNVKPK